MREPDEGRPILFRQEPLWYQPHGETCYGPRVRRTSIFELLTILALCILVGFALANNWGGGIVSGELPSDIDIFPAVPYE